MACGESINTVRSAPCLVVDGQMFSQSIPIAVFLAETFGFHGSSSLESLAINEIIAACAELKRTMGKAIFEKDETQKAELQKQLKEEEIPKYVKIFEKLLGKSESGFFTKKLSVADIIVFDTLEKAVNDNSSYLDGSPKLKTNMEKVRSNAGISAWLKKRPDTEL